MYIGRVCVCVCVNVRESMRKKERKKIGTSQRKETVASVYVCMWVCEKEGERERDSK